MRLLVLLATVVLAAGCGGVASEGSGSGTASTALTAPPRTTSDETTATRPPAVLLDSPAGTQRGELGSWCVDNPSAGVGSCADSGPVHPTQTVVVRPGAELALRLDGARFVRSEGCHSRDTSCIGEAHVTVPGCARLDVARVFLERGEETRFSAPLRPGRYELSVFGYFEADDGRSGDVSAVFGLRVGQGDEAQVESADGTEPATDCR